MSIESRLEAMRTAKVALDAALAQPAMVSELSRHGLLEQFRIASKLINEETHEETMRIMQALDLPTFARDEFGRPLCNANRGYGNCSAPVDPHYTICPTCKNIYDQRKIKEAEKWEARNRSDMERAAREEKPILGGRD